VVLPLGLSTGGTTQLKPSPVIYHAHLHDFVNWVWEDFPLLDLKVGSFWSAAPCGRCLGMGWKCAGPSQTRLPRSLFCKKRTRLALGQESGCLVSISASGT
jgi:hypothetical protein